jgi:hypothetical protein
MKSSRIPGYPLKKSQSYKTGVWRMDTAIQKAEERLVYVSSDKEVLRAYQMREMALSDWTSGINGARREGAKELYDLIRSGKTPEEAMGILDFRR